MNAIVWAFKRDECASKKISITNHYNGVWNSFEMLPNYTGYYVLTMWKSHSFILSIKIVEKMWNEVNVSKCWLHCFNIVVICIDQIEIHCDTILLYFSRISKCEFPLVMVRRHTMYAHFVGAFWFLSWFFGEHSERTATHDIWFNSITVFMMCTSASSFRVEII